LSLPGSAPYVPKQALRSCFDVFSIARRIAPNPVERSNEITSGAWKSQTAEAILPILAPKFKEKVNASKVILYQGNVPRFWGMKVGLFLGLSTIRFRA
jgi:hypothetical protein